jgi:hypothetical protein
MVPAQSRPPRAPPREPSRPRKIGLGQGGDDAESDRNSVGTGSEPATATAGRAATPPLGANVAGTDVLSASMSTRTRARESAPRVTALSGSSRGVLEAQVGASGRTRETSCTRVRPGQDGLRYGLSPRMRPRLSQ